MWSTTPRMRRLPPGLPTACASPRRRFRTAAASLARLRLRPRAPLASSNGRLSAATGDGQHERCLLCLVAACGHWCSVSPGYLKPYCLAFAGLHYTAD